MTHTCSFFPCITLSMFSFAVPCWSSCWSGNIRHAAVPLSHHAAAESQPPWGTSDKASDHSLVTSSVYLSNIWDLYLLPSPFLQQWFSSYFFQAASCFLKILFFFFFSPSFSWTSISSFPNLSSLNGETCLLTVSAGGSLSSLFSNRRIQEVSLLHS